MTQLNGVHPWRIVYHNSLGWTGTWPGGMIPDSVIKPGRAGRGRNGRGRPLFQFAKPLAYSPNLTLKNWLGGLPGGVTSMTVFTALFFSFTVTPLVIGEAPSRSSSAPAA